MEAVVGTVGTAVDVAVDIAGEVVDTAVAVVDRIAVEVGHFQVAEVVLQTQLLAAGLGM